jgi:F-type H+-transporting ATPase subunit delta
MIDSESTPKPKSQAVNVGAQQVAIIYAKAFLGAAQTKGATEALVEELTAVAAALEQFPKLEAVFASALIDPEEKIQILDRVFKSKLSPVVLDALKVLCNHGRLEIVRSVQQEVLKIYDVMRGRVRVELRTATPLDDGLSGQIETSLRKILGGEPKVDPAVDPRLIGGVVLRVGDTVYDGSVARQLSQVHQQMITRSIHEIQSRRDRFRHSGGN